ncbi:MAG: decaprenyl-phosphate phosphoribosyltransferase [Pyrinomonadaceae bacterium]
MNSTSVNSTNRMSVAKAMWRLIRPRQWIKNSFVFTGLLFANAWRQPSLTKAVLLAAAAFSLVASGIYIFNDMADRKQDALHPQKKARPLAAQIISIKAALLLLAVLWLAGLSLGLIASVRVLLLLLVYVAMNIGYSLGLKHVVILDVFIIAGGFMLRILAGTTGVGIAPSQWLLLCGLMIVLFLAFAKRRAELYSLRDESGAHRRVLKNYQPVLLDKMIVVTATCAIMSYSLYTMSPATIATHKTDSLIYTVPFVMYGIFRYIYSLHSHNTGGDPAQDVFRDPHLLVSVVGWLALTLWLISGR